MIRIEDTNEEDVKRLITLVDALLAFRHPSLKRLKLEKQICKENDIDYDKCKKCDLGCMVFSNENDERYYAHVTEIEVLA